MNTRKGILSMATIFAVAIASIAAATPAAAASTEKPNTARLEIPMDVTPFAYLATDKAGNRVDSPSIRDEVIDGKRYLVFTDAGGAGTQILGCAAWNSPAPTYSWPNNNMSYGTQAQCNFAYPVRAKSVVYSGPDDNHLYTWQADTGWKYGVSGVWAGSHSGVCVIPTDDVLWQWELLGYAQGDTDFNGVWENFIPYPGRALKPNACADMV